MTLLTPLGLLGLLGIAALIIIYIIKPNYQQKFVTSTFVWKLSLKYRKKKIPVSKLRNFLLILCQILILTSCAFILAQPNKVLHERVEEPEVIMIIDSSASMRAGSGLSTRYIRAVDRVRQAAIEIFDENGLVSVILANETPTYFKQRVGSVDKMQFDADLKALTNGDTACTYAPSDIDAAVALCEEILVVNPDADIYLYTDMDYAYVPERITLVNVSDKKTEWNASILNAESILEDNCYAFVVDVASFGREETLTLEVEVAGANAPDLDTEADPITFETPVVCLGDEVVKVIFIYETYYNEDPKRYDSTYDLVYKIDPKEKIASYHSVHVSVKTNEPDSFPDDNNFELYDGLKEVIKIQYASTEPNVFWPAALGALKNVYEGKWDIQITPVKKDEVAAVQGFDLYVFEHEAPEELPTDGIVILSNPQDVATKYGVRVGSTYTTSSQLGVTPYAGEDHPITNNLMADRMRFTRFTQLVLDASYTPLFGYKDSSNIDYPLMAVRNDEDLKLVVMPFSLHYSNIAVTEAFPLLVYNMFEYFFPCTVKANSFEVNERVELNARGTELTVTGYNLTETFTSFPAYITVSTPGAYVLTQTTFVGKPIKETIYVRVPEEECNIRKNGDAIAEPYEPKDLSDILEDLLVYIAAALVALLFAEWWLKGRDSM